MPKKTSKKSARRSKAAVSKAAVSKAAARKAAVRTAPAARGGKKKAAARRGSSAAKSRAPSPKQALAGKKVRPVPELYGAVTPQLVVSPCSEALDFYGRAFGAQVLMRIPGADGLLMHAEMSIDGSIIMLADEVDMPGEVLRKSPKNAGAITGGVMLYVADVDAAFKQAVSAGAKAAREPKDEFWGDRFAQVEDPFGHVWSIATHVRDVSPAEMQEAMAQMSPGDS